MPAHNHIEFTRLIATRIATTAAAADKLHAPAGSVMIRTAIDETLIFPPVPDISVDDDYAIIIEDGSYASAWLDIDFALRWLPYNCAWEMPTVRPAFAQGMIADIATKLYFEQERVLMIVPAPYAAEMAAHLAHGGHA